MKRSFIIAAFLLITASAVAQVSGSSVYVGIAMPRKASSAGPVLGYKYQYDLPVAGLGVIGSVQLTSHYMERTRIYVMPPIRHLIFGRRLSIMTTLTLRQDIANLSISLSQ